MLLLSLRLLRNTAVNGPGSLDVAGGSDWFFILGVWTNHAHPKDQYSGHFEELEVS